MYNPDKKIFLSIIWHMHQPFYKDTQTSNYLLPWVRLHGMKDYYDMSALVEECDNLKITFNFVPSLLAQLLDYANDDAIDVFLEITAKPARELDKEDKLFILKYFFMANIDTMIKPNPRYHELYLQRGESTDPDYLISIINTFISQDYLDLQVWFNLAWFDPYFYERDETVAYLIKKGREFTEEDKESLIRAQKKIMSMIIPLYKKLYNVGKIEIITSPFYHPILPLLCNIDIAKESDQTIHLPSEKFTYPDDARMQINKGVNLFEEIFGKKPSGLWPPEGSISEEVAEIISSAGIKWIASDEKILSKSLNTPLRGLDGRLTRHDLLYQPYIFERGDKRINIFFRDSSLSDLIGFVYSKWNHERAVDDFINRIYSIRNSLPEDGHGYIISVILDGENAWEYYKRDGIDFLRALYRKLNEDKIITTITPSEYLKDFEPSKKIGKIHPGSWINADFQIWIGHNEDNTSWDLLSRARNAIKECEISHQGDDYRDKIESAKNEIYIAEGSDWNWWYGDENKSANDEIFDELYRKHLANVYHYLNDEPPDDLNIPIISGVKARIPPSRPVDIVKPVIDGRVTNYYEWFSAASYIKRKFGAILRTDRIIKAIFYGFDNDNMYLRIDPYIYLNSMSENHYRFVVHFLNPIQKRIIININNHGSLGMIAITDTEENPILFEGLEACYVEIVEIKIPFNFLGVKRKDSIDFFVLIDLNKEEIERAPDIDFLSMEVPPEDFEAYIWSAT